MTSQEIFSQALVYEKQIRDLYLTAVDTIDDPRGKKIFQALADDEQSHVDFLKYGLDMLASDNEIDAARVTTRIPDPVQVDIQAMASKIPEQMLGDIKRVLNAALALEIETTAFYKESFRVAQGKTADILTRFYEIEQRHVDVVQMELDHASGNGLWFDFMEMDMEDGFL